MKSKAATVNFFSERHDKYLLKLRQGDKLKNKRVSPALAVDDDDDDDDGDDGDVIAAEPDALNGLDVQLGRGIPRILPQAFNSGRFPAKNPSALHHHQHHNQHYVDSDSRSERILHRSVSQMEYVQMKSKPPSQPPATQQQQQQQRTRSPSAGRPVSYSNGGYQQEPIQAYGKSVY